MKQIFGDKNWLLPVNPDLSEYQPERTSFKDSERLEGQPEMYKKYV